MLSHGGLVFPWKTVFEIYIKNVDSKAVSASFFLLEFFFVFWFNVGI